LLYFAIKKKLVLRCLDFPGMSKGKNTKTGKLFFKKELKPVKNPH